MGNTVGTMTGWRVGRVLEVALALVLFNSLAVASVGAPNTANRYFAIRVVDRQTGRGVPLVELRTTNHIRHYTDSNGIVAFREPGLMDREVFFHVESHGYEFPKDGFGYRGTRLKTVPGTTATIKIKRLNIAERLYRVTGQGIYRDSILTGRSTPLKHPVLNGQVTGQDSVFTCLYHDRIFWMWGDTGRPSYPLGHFAMAAAVSDPPGRGGLDPAIGVDLEYVVDKSGFSRPVARLKESGLVWLDGLMTVQDPQGAERMVAKFARLKDLGKVLERGLMAFNDATETFEPLVRSDLDFLPYANTGHAFTVDITDHRYYYFTSPSPMGARTRVRAQWDDIIDPNQYEVLTALMPGSSDDGHARWVTFGDILASMGTTKAAVIEALEAEAKDVRVYDVESGQAVAPHNGTVYYNAYRQRWIGIFVQEFGENSYLGEVWYAEADTPVGPWAYARKIVTHNKYSFYNPKQHPLFAQDGGRIIYFEGTYSHTFSRDAETATPRYDYNQIMYRLSLDDPRLALLPAPVYETQGERNERQYLLREGIERTGIWGRLKSVPFCAVASNGTNENLMAIYTQSAATTRLGPERPTASSTPLFFALPPVEIPSENASVVNLYEYHHAESERYRYSTESQLNEKGWRRAANPLCRVWKMPPNPLLIDPQAKPANL